MVPESASIANRVFASFLARLPPARSDPQPPYPTRLDDALRRLGEIMRDPNISTRDPCSPMAFSCVPPALVRWRTQVYARAAAGHRAAFSPLDRSGRPKRRYVAYSYYHSPSVHLWRNFTSDIPNDCRNNGLNWTETGSHTQVCAGRLFGMTEGVIRALRLFLEQSEESQTRKHVATYDERLEVISQKLAREFSIASAWRHIKRVPPEAIERIALSNGLSSRITSTAGLAAWAIQRLPI